VLGGSVLLFWLEVSCSYFPHFFFFLTRTDCFLWGCDQVVKQSSFAIGQIL